jgi:diguanylate cyclase (GGDEF)-like protein
MERVPTTPPLPLDRAARESTWLARRAQAAVRVVRFATAPPIATPKAMARTAGLLYIAASTMSLVGLWLPQRPGVRVLQETVLGVISLGVGVALVLVGYRWRRWSYHVLIFVGNVLIALTMYNGGGGRTSMAYASLYVFVALNCFFFFAWPSACLHLAVAIATCLVALVAVGEADFGQVILIPGTLIVVAGTVGWLVRAAGAAEVDRLTGLPNRRGLDRVLTDAVMDAALGANTVSLVFLDVDHFRDVNAKQSPAGGDRLLRTIANAWRALIGEGELLARYGGDEFALLLTHAQPGDVIAVTDRLRAAMPNGHTCSAGAADWELGDTVSLLSARADAAMYESKCAGRNRLTHHDSNRTLEEAALRRAIEAGEVVAYYMPIVELATGLVTGVEALARWIRPGHGVVPPDDFIPQAEASGAIEDIGWVMLVAACRQVQVWSKIHGRPFIANVNVCGRELRNPGYVAQVRAILLDADLPASQLLLELTETAFEGNADLVIAALEELHAMGVGIAIDDFGTGYSSLSRLDRLPVDIVKIDRSFVSPLPPEATRAPLVAAITAMARALGLRVVAEGIEHPYQAALMSELGCDEGQGYWFDRPCAADQVDLSRREPAVKIRLADGEGDVPIGLSVVG